MTEKQYSPSAKDKKVAEAGKKKMMKTEIKKEEIRTEDKKMEKKIETKVEKKKEEKKVVKESACVNGFSLRISPKYSVEVLKLVRGKTPEEAVKRMEEVIKFRRAVPMARLEVAHRHGKGIAGGKYPIRVCKEIVELLKQVKANAVFNGIENPVITIAKANQAAAPYRRGGRKAKRTHIYIEVKNKVDGGKK